MTIAVREHRRTLRTTAPRELPNRLRARELRPDGFPDSALVRVRTPTWANRVDDAQSHATGFVQGRMPRRNRARILERVRHLDPHGALVAVDLNTDWRAAVLDRVRDQLAQHEEQQVDGLDVVPACERTTSSTRCAGTRHHCWQQELHGRHGGRFLTARFPTTPVTRRSPPDASPAWYPGAVLSTRNRLRFRTACPPEEPALHLRSGLEKLRNGISMPRCIGKCILCASRGMLARTT
jgi:hypothetical protein